MFGDTKLSTAFLVGSLLAFGGGTVQADGGLFVTGHDPDYHSFVGGNTAGARNIIVKALDFTTDGIANNGNAFGNILLLTSRTNPGGDESDPVFGLTAAGVTFDIADAGVAGGSVLNFNTLNLNNYGAIVVASDYGGWLSQAEATALIARKNDILEYIDDGGAVVAFAEAGNRPGPPTGITNPADRWGWLPFLTAAASLNQSEIDYTVTPFGTSLGLSVTDINGNASHNIFVDPLPSGMQVVDRDSQNNVISLAFYGPINAIPEPGTCVIFSLGLGLLGWQLRRRLTSTT